MLEQSSVKVPFAEKLAYFDERLKLFSQVIGGWPPNLESAEQKNEVRTLWEKDFSYAIALYQDYPNEIDAN